MSDCDDYLKYSQGGGFQVISIPFEWKEAESETEWLLSGGFKRPEESEGEFHQYAGADDYCAVLHRYHEDGRRLTVLNGVEHSTYILTENAAEHMALRVALAPLAHVRMAADIASIRSEHGTLLKWLDRAKEQEREQRRKARAKK